MVMGPKTVCVLRVTGLKILDRVGTTFFSTEIPFSKCIKKYIFQKTLKNHRFDQYISVGPGYSKHMYFFYSA